MSSSMSMRYPTQISDLLVFVSHRSLKNAEFGSEKYMKILLF